MDGWMKEKKNYKKKKRDKRVDIKINKRKKMEKNERVNKEQVNKTKQK